VVLHLLYPLSIDCILFDLLRNLRNQGIRIQDSVSCRLDSTCHWFGKAHNIWYSNSLAIFIWDEVSQQAIENKKGVATVDIRKQEKSFWKLILCWSTVSNASSTDSRVCRRNDFQQHIFACDESLQTLKQLSAMVHDSNWRSHGFLHSLRLSHQLHSTLPHLLILFLSNYWRWETRRNFCAGWIGCKLPKKLNKSYKRFKSWYYTRNRI
jgi:hypothetical protein